MQILENNFVYKKFSWYIDAHQLDHHANIAEQIRLLKVGLELVFFNPDHRQFPIFCQNI